MSSTESSRTGRTTAVEWPSWLVFAWASTLFALVPGFLLGGSIFFTRMAGPSTGTWQLAAAQAHGHAQIFGWGGLMALGIGLHFLPRLLSVNLPHERWPRWILWLMSSGLSLRVLSQPIMAAASHGWWRRLGAVGLGLAATMELTGAMLAGILVVSLFTRADIGAKRVPSRGVAGLIGIAFLSLAVALLANWIGSFDAAARQRWLIDARADGVVVLLGLVGFLCSMSLAMSARLFPLYVQTRLPREGWLRASAAAMLIGLTLTGVGIVTLNEPLAGAGRLIVAFSLLNGIVAIRILEPRRPLPRRPVLVRSNPLQLHVISAYVWLAIAAIFALLDGLHELGVGTHAVSLDAVRHAVGAGFVTLLILGVGSEMLPGLARACLRWPGLRWLTLLLANAAALARVVPLLVQRHGDWNVATQGTAGILGALAIVIFLLNLPRGMRPSATRKSTTG